MRSCDELVIAPLSTCLLGAACTAAVMNSVPARASTRGRRNMGDPFHTVDTDESLAHVARICNMSKGCRWESEAPLSHPNTGYRLVLKLVRHTRDDGHGLSNDLSHSGNAQGRVVRLFAGPH